MPELPDVETFKRYMNETALHHKIDKVNISAPKLVKNVSAATIKRRLKGQKFDAIKRHGKYLFAHLNNDYWIIFHFGMTGYLKYFKDQNEQPPHVRMQVNFSNNYHLAYDCRRKFGEIDGVTNPDDFIKEKELGPDPIEDEIDFKTFKELFNNRTGAVKSALMNQQILAGIGNIYSDEILFQAKIFPGKSLNKIDDKELKKIYRMMNKVLEKAIKVKADPEKMPNFYLIHHRNPGDDCPKCDGKIKKKTIGGRSSYYCNKHQK